MFSSCAFIFHFLGDLTNFFFCHVEEGYTQIHYPKTCYFHARKTFSSRPASFVLSNMAPSQITPEPWYIEAHYTLGKRNLSNTFCSVMYCVLGRLPTCYTAAEAMQHEHMEMWKQYVDFGLISGYFCAVLPERLGESEIAPLVLGLSGDTSWCLIASYEQFLSQRVVVEQLEMRRLFRRKSGLFSEMKITSFVSIVSRIQQRKAFIRLLKHLSVCVSWNSLLEGIR